MLSAGCLPCCCRRMPVQGGLTSHHCLLAESLDVRFYHHFNSRDDSALLYSWAIDQAKRSDVNASLAIPSSFSDV